MYRKYLTNLFIRCLTFFDLNSRHFESLPWILLINELGLDSCKVYLCSLYRAHKKKDLLQNKSKKLFFDALTTKLIL